MKARLRSFLTNLVLTSCLLLATGSLSWAQASPPADPTSGAATSSSTGKPEAESTSDQFRHARMVQAIARLMHVSIETAAQMLEDINSAILVLLILYFLMKVVPKAFRHRSETIQKQLIDARSATESANQRLSAVEAKLAKLGEDIDGIRQQTERDLVEDEKRIKQALEEERVRIIKSAEHEIDSAGAAAQRDLKRFAAELAVDKAATRIQLTAESDKAIVARFGQDLIGQLGKGGRN